MGFLVGPQRPGDVGQGEGAALKWLEPMVVLPQPHCAHLGSPNLILGRGNKVNGPGAGTPSAGICLLMGQLSSSFSRLIFTSGFWALLHSERKKKRGGRSACEMIGFGGCSELTTAHKPQIKKKTDVILKPANCHSDCIRRLKTKVSLKHYLPLCS